MKSRALALLLWRFTVRSLLARPLHSLLTVGGVALGLALVMAVHISTNLAVDSFAESLNLLEGPSDFHIAGSGYSLDEKTWLRDLEWFWDVGSMSARVEGSARLETGEEVRLLGVDLVGDPLLIDSLAAAGGESAADGTDEGAEEPFLNLFDNPYQLVVSELLAQRLGWTSGAEVTLTVRDREWSFRVGRILRPRGIGRVFGGQLLVADIAAAQEVLGKSGLLDRIDFKLNNPQDGASLERVKEQVRGKLVFHGRNELARQSRQMLSSFQLNLQVLSYLSLIVGIVLIYNAVSLSAVARRTEVAILRAMGTPRWPIFGLFLAEAIIFGLLGAAVGLLGAPRLSRLAGSLVGRTVGEFYGGSRMPPAAQGMDLETAAGFLCLGICVAVFSGLRPAWSATNVAPLEILREGSWSTAPDRHARSLSIAAACSFGAASAATLAPPLFGVPALGYLACFLYILSFSLAAPPLIRRLLGIVTRWVSPFLRVEARLALRQLRGNAGRVTMAVVSLMIAVSMFVGVATMVGSFRDTVQAWVNQSLKADLFVEAVAASSTDWSGFLSAESVGKIESIPGVEAVGTFRGSTIDYQGVPVTLAGAALDVLAQRGGLLFLDARPTSEIIKRAKGEGSLLISEPFSRRFNLRRGDLVELRTPLGVRSFRVESRYYDYSSDRGVMVMDRSLFAHVFGDTNVNTLAVYIGQQEAAGQIAETIRQVLDNRAIRIASNAQLRAGALRVFDRTFQITYALEVIALFVAALGITNTLATLIVERKGEFSLLRFLGAMTSQLRTMTLVEATLLGLLGCLLGSSLGVCLSLVLVYVINPQSFGWTIQFGFPFAFIGAGLILILGVTIAAGFYPALLSGRVDALRELRAE